MDLFPLEDLPDSVHVQVIRKLTIKQRIIVERTSKRWQKNAKYANLKETAFGMVMSTPFEGKLFDCNQPCHVIPESSIIRPHVNYPDMVTFLKRFPNLISLVIDGHFRDPKGFVRSLNTLCPKLQHLELNYWLERNICDVVPHLKGVNCLKGGGSPKVLEGLKDAKNLTKLNWTFSDPQDEDWTSIDFGHSLKLFGTRLELLAIEDCREDYAALFEQVAMTCPNLIELRITNRRNCGTELYFDELTSLGRLKKLRKLYIWRYKSFEEGVRGLLDVFKQVLVLEIGLIVGHGFHEWPKWFVAIRQDYPNVQIDCLEEEDKIWY